MWPPGHLAFGYLLLVAADRYTGSLAADREPGSRSSRARLLVLALATQLPDLVDKPLAWWLAVGDGRSLAHSVFAAAILIVAVTLLCRRIDRTALALPFALGYCSHLLADALRPLWTGHYADLGFLVWPLAQRPPRHLVGLVPYLRSMAFSPYALLQAALVVAALAVWWRRAAAAA